MKKLLLSTAGGFGVATVCGLSGLPHLSATLVTLTVFGLAHAVIFYVAAWGFHVIERLPTWLHAWLAPPDGEMR
jgi:hypothetical protein